MTYNSLTATCHIRDIDTQGVDNLCLPKTTQMQPNTGDNKARLALYWGMVKEVVKCVA